MRTFTKSHKLDNVLYDVRGTVADEAARMEAAGISELGRSTQGVKVMNVADKDKVCAVAIASTGKKKAKKAAPADENQRGLLEEESEEGTLAIDDLDDLEVADAGREHRRLACRPHHQSGMPASARSRLSARARR